MQAGDNRDRTLEARQKKMRAKKIINMALSQVDVIGNDYKKELKEISEIADDQNHRCAICNSEFHQNNKIRIDYSDKGHIRGLICNHCLKIVTGLFGKRNSKYIIKSIIYYVIYNVLGREWWYQDKNKPKSELLNEIMADL